VSFLRSGLCNGAMLDRARTYATSRRGHDSLRGLLAAAIWRREGRHRYVPSAVNSVKGSTTGRGSEGSRSSRVEERRHRRLCFEVEPESIIGPFS
jgi:hypothetical protein